MEIQLNTFKISWFDFITLHIWLTQKLKKSWYIIGFQINWNRVKHFQNQLIWYYHITHQINAKTQKIMINHWFQINENTIKHIKIIWFDIITLHIRLTQKIMIYYCFQNNWDTIKHSQNHLIWFYHITYQIYAKNQKIMIYHWHLN